MSQQVEEIEAQHLNKVAILEECINERKEENLALIDRNELLKKLCDEFEAKKTVTKFETNKT